MADEGVQAPIHKNRGATMPKIYNYFNKTTYKDVNYSNKIYEDSRPVDLSYWKLPGGEGAWKEYTFDQIISQTFEPITLGNKYGPTWSTHWFKIDYEIPEAWAGREVVFHWMSGTEATVWSTEGKVLQGLSTGTGHQMRPDFTLSNEATPGSGTIYVEMVAGTLFGAGQGDQIGPEDKDKYYTLSKAEIIAINKEAYKLSKDIEVLHDLATYIDDSNPISNMAMFTANQMVNSIIDKDIEGASNIADNYFTKGNGARAHTLATIGNCHIDTAWLWPYSETIRKVARSYSSQLKIMEEYPEHIFVASQAQQWAWLKEYYPELFERVKSKVAEGNFIPVGGTWVEMDGNIPSGESFVRQFFYGQKFYKNELNFTCKEFWLPDTFGYSAQIPALMRHMGLSRFLTQKLSWNFVNKFPHHNFTWEGIDGSTVLAHFPPGESYSMELKVSECLHTVRNLEDKGRVSTSALLFGYGDGGGGPTKHMLERARRLKDVDGCPKVQLMTPNGLFTQLEKEQHNMARWIGELYLELHNGTYTSQTKMKQLCRNTEFELRNAEFMLSMALQQKKDYSQINYEHNMEIIEVAWKKVLLNQFHDVLPGSGIGRIYDDAVKLYNEANESADEVFNQSFGIIADNFTSPKLLVNTLQWPRREVVSTVISKNKENEKCIQNNGKEEEDYCMVEVQGFGLAPLTPVETYEPVTLTQEGDTFKFKNDKITAIVTKMGQVVSLKANDDESDRDVFNQDSCHGNEFVIFDDEPIYWDAWDVPDYHLESPRRLNYPETDLPTTFATITSSGPLVATLEWGIVLNNKTEISQTIELTAESPYLVFKTQIEWGESHKILKVFFNTDLLIRSANFDIQFGHLNRPTHMNTSWDSARYEVCGHKWADISEETFGLAVLNQSKYGWMARQNTLSLSLLKSPKNPDDECDMGYHSINYALMPHTGNLQSAKVVQRAYEFNNRIHIKNNTRRNKSSTADDESYSWASLEGRGIVLHTIKPADDNTDGKCDSILRFYECDGNQSKATLKLNFDVKDVVATDGTEVPGDQLSYYGENGATFVPLTLKPFEIKAIRVSF